MVGISRSGCFLFLHKKYEVRYTVSIDTEVSFITHKVKVSGGEDL